MEKSEQINELATALAKAQGMIGGALKDSENPFFKSKYADLKSVWSVIKQPLSTNGLSVVQTPETSENGVKINTMLLHSSGQWISSYVGVPVGKKDAQGLGSAISYGRRYALASIVGVYQEDDDGNNSSGEENAIVLEKLSDEISLLNTVPETEQYYRDNVNKYPNVTADLIKALATRKAKIVEELSNENT